MQGYAFKTIIVSLTLLSTTISSSMIFAASANISKPSVNSAAGCMGCHQGEALPMAANEQIDQSSKDAKKDSPQTISK